MVLQVYLDLVFTFPARAFGFVAVAVAAVADADAICRVPKSIS